ncbi:MAG TPA: hypothetical protein VNT20_10975 [Flavisolibacter sp.]|jgi:hypothetical protein|nr:hypothetical protein [Flavisolibacter sp.]
MKRLFFTVSLFACLFSLPAFAKDKNIPDVLTSFYKTFQNAANVNWSVVDDMLRIGFTTNGREQFAYYSNDELVVVATELKAEELPAALQQQLSAYKGYHVSRAYELNNNNVKEYCVVIDNSSRHITLKGKNKLKICFEDRY